MLHFVYLTCSFPGVFTSDHWRNVETLELDPDFADYVGEAFKPLGVYLNFWQPRLKAGSSRRFAVSIVNDYAEGVKGRLALTIEQASGGPASRAETPFEVPALGQQSYAFELKIPAVPGDYVVKAAAYPEDSLAKTPTISRRQTNVME